MTTGDAQHPGGDAMTQSPTMPPAAVSLQAPAAPAFRPSRFAAGWAVVLAAALLLGPAAGWLVALLLGEDGGPAATVLVGQSPIIGLLVGVGVGLLSIAAIGIGAWAVSVNVGLVAGGAVLAWAAARSGRVDDLAIASPNGPWQRLALEGIAWGLFVAGVCFVVWRVRPASRERLRRSSRESGRLVTSLIVGTAAAMAAAWLVAVEPAKGQTLAAAVAAGIACAVTARMVSVGVPRLVLLWIPVLLGAAMPLLAILLPGGDVLRLASLTPLDWIAGGLLGVPVGAAWTESVVERADPDERRTA
ncbi:MAG: hypothetical protein AAGF47_08210 [Planctomycetota bacterium]